MPRKAFTAENHLTVSAFKGVNLTDPRHVIDDREFESITNLIINDAGDLIRRKPMRYFHLSEDGTGSTLVLGIFFNRVVYATGDNVYLSPFDTDLSDTYTLLATSGEDSNNAILYNKVLYIWSNGSSPALTAITVSDWTADVPTFGAGTITGSPPTDIVKSVIFKDRCFAIKDPGEKSSRVNYSAVTDPGNWSGGGFLDVSPGDGDFITDILPFGERLFIFKRDSTWTLTVAGDPNAWILKQFDRSVGAATPYSTLEYRGLLYCLSARGMYRSDGVVFDYIGYPIQDRYLDNPIPVDTGFAYVHTQFITMVDDYILIISGNANIGNWFFNPVQNAWTECIIPDLPVSQLSRGIQGYLRNGTRVTVFGWLRPSGVSNLLYFGLPDPDNLANAAYSDYILHNATAGSRIITPVATSFKTKEWDMGSFVKTKRHKYAVIEMDVPSQAQITDAEFQTSYLVNRATTLPTHEFRIDQDHRGVMAHKVPGAGYARRLQLQFNSSTTLDYSITGYDMTYFQKRAFPENPE